MKTKTQEEKTTISEILTITENYTSKVNPSQLDLIQLADEVFNKVIFKWQNIFNEIPKPTREEADDTSDFLIEVCDLIIISAIRCHSLDVMDAPYEIPESKLKKLKKHLSRILILPKDKRRLFNEFLSIGFFAAYFTSIRKASEHRELVLKEKVKRKGNPKDN